MSRLFRLSLVLVGTASLGLSSPVQAGVLPWAYDALFGPVGSMQARRAGYAPYYAGYSGNYGGGYTAGYAPYSVGYGYGGSGCSSCGQSSNYVTSYGGGSYYNTGCGCFSCGNSCGMGGCASGNCATGACSTTTNAPPAGGLGPVPDPANSARSIESRLEVIEKALNIPSPRNNSKARTYEADGFNSRPTGGAAADPELGTDSTIPSRPARGTDPNDPTFVAPTRPKPGTFGTEQEPFEENPGRGNTGRQESFKPKTDGVDLGVPDPVIPEKKPAPGGAAIEDTKPQTLRLDSRVTSRAVSPRERQSIAVGFAKPVVAARKPAARPLQSDATPNGMNLARH